jgi:hypothetical protein
MSWRNIPIQKKVFVGIAIIFTIVMICFAIDFSKKTASPWNKKKFNEKYRVK